MRPQDLFGGKRWPQILACETMGINPNIFENTKTDRLRLQLQGAIYRPDSFVLMLRYCANLKAIRYESTSLKGIVADKSHRVIVA